MGIVTLVAAILGMILGTVSLTLSILNYLRDRPAVRVLQQSGVVTPEHPAPFTIVHVANTGRRPVFIMYVGIELPSDACDPFLILNASEDDHGRAKGTRLAEGDPPLVYTVVHQDLMSFSANPVNLRAFAKDIAGRMYYAKPAESEPSAKVSATSHLKRTSDKS